MVVTILCPVMSKHMIVSLSVRICVLAIYWVRIQFSIDPRVLCFRLSTFFFSLSRGFSVKKYLLSNIYFRCQRFCLGYLLGYD